MTKPNTRKLPNFLIIGAAKSGTTALSHYLEEHPQIYMSPLQEPKFFSFINHQERLRFNGVRDQEANAHVIRRLEDYYSLFSGCSSEVVIGESSPCYLYYEQTAHNIYQTLPNAQIIAILRNPVDRAYSNFLHMVSSGRERIYDFSQALLAEDERIKDGWEYFWHYKNQGFYYQKIKQYLSYFKDENIKIILYEDYKQKNNAILASIFNFLQVDNTFIPKLDRQYNVTQFPVSKLFHRILSEPHPSRNIVKKIIPKSLRHFILHKSQVLNSTHKLPPLKKDLKESLISDYREDILHLQDLLNRDLSAWLKIG